MSEIQSAAGLSSGFIDNAPANILETNKNQIRGVIGRSNFFSHTNHLKDPIKNKISCGHAAIATLLDFHDKCSYPLKRLDYGTGYANDGKKHFSNDLVDRVFNDYPPANVFGIKFTVRESILMAMKKNGIKAEEAYSGAFGNGEHEKGILMDWIRKYKLPVLVLMDCHVLSKHVKWWQGNPPGWYILHWGFIVGYDSSNVIFASWGEIKTIPWKAFMESWHCPGLPYPNNYYAIYTYL